MYIPLNQPTPPVSPSPICPACLGKKCITHNGESIRCGQCGGTGYATLIKK